MNWFAMVNKMVPRDFFYAQGLQSYDNSKGENVDEEDCLSFWRMDLWNATKNGAIIGRSYL